MLWPMIYHLQTTTQKINLRKLIKKNIKARLTSRKFNGNKSERDNINLIQTKKKCGYFDYYTKKN